MRAVILVLALLQFGPRVPLTPAETLLEPVVLRALDEVTPAPTAAAVAFIEGSTPAAGEVLVSCAARTTGPDGCATMALTARLLNELIRRNGLPQPARGIRFAFVTSPDKTGAPPPNTKAAIHVDFAANEHALQVVRSPWSSASVVDEVVEVFARHKPYGTAPGAVEAGPYRNVGQPQWDAFGVPTVSLIGAGAAPTGLKHLDLVTAATAYFLATLPNPGAEALLSHLTVGAHARLAEDGRKAVAQMGNQQRASADVLIMFGQAIEREQRRIRSVERFMPEPVDPMLRSRLSDMEKAITSVWTSIGITSAPWVPPAERIRGRGGEDRRVPSRTAPGRLQPIEPPTALLKFERIADIVYELGNLVDGRRSISDTRDVLSAEFGPISLPVLVDYFERLAAAGAIVIK